MKIITSKNNLKIKQLRFLHKKKKRDEYGLFVVENLITISDAFKSGFKFKSLFVVKNLLQNEKVKYLLKHSDNCYIIDDEISKSVSLLSTPSGIYAIYKMLDEKVDYLSDILYLNAVSDPGNLGTIIRTAVAFDVGSVVVDEKCSDIYNEKTISASKDAVFKINIHHDKNLQLLKKIKDKMNIYVTDVKGKNGIISVCSNKNKCIVFGNESHGVDMNIKKLADKFINIKINKKIESLNVAVSAGIILQQRLLEQDKR